MREFENKITSQNGEDGVIAEILRRVGLTQGRFLEIGAGYGGAPMSNCLQLFKAGWPGLFVDVQSGRLERLAADFPTASTLHYHVTPDNINGLGNCDVLSIDVDGNDYWLWKAYRFRPALAIVEFNSDYPPPQLWVMARDDDFTYDGATDYYGASLESLARLGGVKGYGLVHVESNMVNAFFVSADFLHHFLPLSMNPADHFRPIPRRHAHRDGPHLEI